MDLVLEPSYRKLWRLMRERHLKKKDLHVKMLIESFNQFTNTLTEEEKRIVKQTFSGYIGKGDSAKELEPAVCVYYDAWANDNDEDPILSLVYEIIKDTKSDYPFKKSTDCIKTAATIVGFSRSFNHITASAT